MKDITCFCPLFFRLEQMYQVAEKIQKEVSKRILFYEK